MKISFNEEVETTDRNPLLLGGILIYPIYHLFGMLSEGKIPRESAKRQSIRIAYQFLNEINNKQSPLHKFLVDVKNGTTPFPSRYLNKVKLANESSKEKETFIDNELPELKYHYAIVIGLSKYKYASEEGLTELRYASEDARNFYETLIKLGWKESEIKLLVNDEATKANIESWIRYTPNLENSQVVIYWAGHGYPDPVDERKFFFACYDTDVLNPGSGLRMDDVKSWLYERNARNVILIADTCHTEGILSRDLNVIPKINVDIPKGWIFLRVYNKKAFEHPALKSGLFTYCLLKALNGEADGYGKTGKSDGNITIGEIHEYVNDKLKELATNFHLSGNFDVEGKINTSDKSIWNLTLQRNKEVKY
jgi:hypothetical protein